METTTFTATDVAAFAELLRPAFDRINNGTLSPADTVLAAAVVTKEQEGRDFARRLTQIHILADALSGTYDEFRAEG